MIPFEAHIDVHLLWRDFMAGKSAGGGKNENGDENGDAAANRIAKNKNLEVARRHPGGLGTELNTQSFPGC